MLDYGRLSQSMKLQYEEEAGFKKKTRKVAMGGHIFQVTWQIHFSNWKYEI